jgi:hypothetical protein
MLMSFLQQNQSQGQNGTCLKLRRGGGKDGGGGQGGEMTQTMYAHKKKNVERIFVQHLPLQCLKNSMKLFDGL